MASTAIHRSVTSATAIKKFTLSMWVKRSIITDSTGRRMFTANGGTGDVYFRFNNDDKIEWSGHGSNASSAGYFITTRLFRDPASWYHLVIKVDTTQGSSSDRLKFYVNGVEETSFSSQTLPDQDATDNIVNTSMVHRIGGISGQYFDGLLTHVHFTQGYAYDASTFGEFDSTSGIWVPKTAPSVTYGTNGFFLKFENSGAMGTDSSGNSNTFSTTSGTLTQNVDSPDNNFTVLNAVNNGAAASTLTNGNLTYSLSNYSHNTRSTMALTSGKYYWEQKQSDINSRIGLCTSGFRNDLDTDSTDAIIGGTGNGGLFLVMSAAGTSWQMTNNNTSRSVTTYTNAIASGANDILMGAVDVDAGKLWIGVNGTWFNSGNPATAANPTLTFTNNGIDPLQVYAGFGTDSARVVHYNFGSGYFGTTAVASGNADGNNYGSMEYAVPSGFYTICSENIKEFG